MAGSLVFGDARWRVFKLPGTDADGVWVDGPWFAYDRTTPPGVGSLYASTLSDLYDQIIMVYYHEEIGVRRQRRAQDDAFGEDKAWNG